MNARTLVFSVVALAGCAPSLSTMQPAHVAKEGHVQAEGGFDVSIPTGSIKRTIDAAKPLMAVARSRALTEGEQLEVFDASVNLAMNPPAPATHLGLAYGVVEDLEIGLRWASGAWRLGARYQLFHQDRSGLDLSVGLGVARMAYEFPVNDILGLVTIEDFVRYQFDLPLLLGISGDFYRLWGGPKLLITSFGTSIKLDIPAIKTTELAKFDGRATYVGGQIGAALGYKKVFVAFELTLAQLFGNATTTILDKEHKSTLGSFIVHPSFGLMIEI